MNIIQSPSKNFYNGRFGHKPELIVVHITDGYFPGDLNWLRGASNPPVSSSYFIAPDGTAHQLVDDANGAWHAGRILNPTFKLFKGMNINPNWYTIGIEVSCRPPAVPAVAQMNSLKELIKELCVKHNIPVDRDHIIG
ncbi:MAG: N-acetylmuramoyl-L-alanine amidase, partial [Candidatus Berkelbacteria bacterium]|nr:N-acetylmuramoyl-L-alanine amidase [Candidatus Berkelbacteria bacterium]